MAAKQTAIPAAEMRLIFKGKILKDEMTLEDYKITDGLTIHLVKGGAKGPAASTAPPTGTAPTTAASTAPADTGAQAQPPNPFAGGMPAGMPPGMAGMFGGMGGGAGGAGGMPGMPGMGGMGGAGGMPNPQMMKQMM